MECSIIKIQKWYRINRLKNYINENKDFFNKLCFLKSEYNYIDCEKFLKDESVILIYSGFIDRLECFLKNNNFYKGNKTDSIISFYIFGFSETIKSRSQIHFDLIEESTKLVKCFLTINNNNNLFERCLEDYLEQYISFNNCYVICDLILNVENKKKVFDKVCRFYRSIDIIEKKKMFKTNEQQNKALKDINTQIKLNKKIIGYKDIDFDKLINGYNIRFLNINFNDIDTMFNNLLEKIEDCEKRKNIMHDFNKIKQNKNEGIIIDFLVIKSIEISNYVVYKEFFDLEYKNKYNIHGIKNSKHRKDPDN